MRNDLEDTLARLNILIFKHAELFSKDRETPSWDEVIEKLDTILTAYKENTIKWKNPNRIKAMHKLYEWAVKQIEMCRGNLWESTNPISKIWIAEIKKILEGNSD